MANPLRGEVGFECDGKSYTMSFSTNSLIELEEKLDMNVGEIGKLMSTPEKFRMKMLRTVFWAGLQDHHPEVSMESVSSLLKKQSPGETIDIVSRAFAVTFPDAEGGAARPPEGAKAAAGNGQSSSPPGKP